MTNRDVAALVTQGIALDREIRQNEKVLQQLKAKLRNEAERRIRATTAGLDAATPLRGYSHVFEGTCGNAARVEFPNAGLVRQIVEIPDSRGNPIAHRYQNKQLVPIGNLRKLCGDHFESLFAKLYKPAKAFRELCCAVLGAKDGESLIDLCEEDTSPRVVFAHKK